MLSIDPKEVSTAVLHSYLLGAVAPRPIAFASTIDKDGNPNLAPFSFLMYLAPTLQLLFFLLQEAEERALQSILTTTSKKYPKW